MVPPLPFYRIYRRLDPYRMVGQNRLLLLLLFNRPSPKQIIPTLLAQKLNEQTSPLPIE